MATKFYISKNNPQASKVSLYCNTLYLVRERYVDVIQFREKRDEIIEILSYNRFSASFPVHGQVVKDDIYVAQVLNTLKEYAENMYYQLLEKNGKDGAFGNAHIT